MDRYHAKALINQFLAVYAWRYAYVNRSWWCWDVDHGHWDWMGVPEKLGNTFTIIAEDLYPEDLKIRRQVGMDYLIKQFMVELRPILTSATLPCTPQPGSRARP